MRRTASQSKTTMRRERRCSSCATLLEAMGSLTATEARFVPCNGYWLRDRVGSPPLAPIAGWRPTEMGLGGEPHVQGICRMVALLRCLLLLLGTWLTLCLRICWMQTK
jgi:hypothetical protein